MTNIAISFLSGIAVAVATVAVARSYRSKAMVLIKEFVNEIAAKLGPVTATPQPSSFVSDPVWTHSIQIFNQRAQNWKRIADFTFRFSIITVAVGILIFVFADRIAINSDQLPLLLSKRDQLREEMLKEKEGREHVIADRELLPDVLQKWQSMTLTIQGLINSVNKAAPKDGDDPKGVAAREDELRLWMVTEKSKSATHRKFLESIGLTSSDSALTHTSYQRQFIDDAAVKVTPSLGDVSKAVEQWLDFIERSLNDNMLDPEELVQARKLVDSSKASLKSMTTINDKLRGQSEAAEKKYKDQLPPDKRLAISEKEFALENLEEEISRVRQEFNPNNLYSVIPLLVVRGGAVLMLLFLTQILLAAYRYTNMLSTHYSAVADSLCLTHQAFPGSGPDNDQFIKLLQALNPKDLSYIPPKAPTDQFVTLATQIK